jgi:hypothetical protein
MTQKGFDPHLFEVGEPVEYNMKTSHYTDAPEGWFLGHILEIDEEDPDIPWRILVSLPHRLFTNEPDGACWFRRISVRKYQYVIEELLP